MKLYRTQSGIILEASGSFRTVEANWDTLVCDARPRAALSALYASGAPAPNPMDRPEQLLPPVGSQEVWASGVTYYRSRSARMEESKAAGGGSFYDRVYDAERPELFFKAAPYRVAGPGQPVRIRRDSEWNVPEPELTLLLSPAGEVTGYTIGNDMSSRSIEGENPLYLPQAKSYEGSTAIGPCLYFPEQPLPGTTEIHMEIRRGDADVFRDSVAITQIKRSFEALAGWLFREMRFPHGCLLMTGTGIVPPNDFTLHAGDEIRISIPPIGTLANTVAPE